MKPQFEFRIVAAAGVLCFGSSPDFLVSVVLLERKRFQFQTLLPASTIRVQLFYPSGRQVAPSELEAAIRALKNPFLIVQVNARMAMASAAKRAATCRAGFAVDVGSDFCQAGVVAPPDSLTGETLSKSGSGV